MEHLKMSISLEKGQQISLSKNGTGLTKIFMGLGWDAIAVPAPARKGFLGTIFAAARPVIGAGNIDLDASVIILDANKSVIDTVSFAQLKSNDGAIRHAGDNLTGDGDGDDEVIHLDLTKLNPLAAFLVFTVNSYSGQTFDTIENAVARLVDDTTGIETCRYTLSERGAHTGVIMASLAKTSEGWVMTAQGVPASGKYASDMRLVAISVL